MSAVRAGSTWPLLAIGVLLLIDVFFGSSFFNLRMQDGHLYGSLIDILRFGAPLMLVALGMTLVIATGGIDLSVGAVVAISGATACLLISQPRQPERAATGVLIAVAAALGLSMAARRSGTASSSPSSASSRSSRR